MAVYQNAPFAIDKILSGVGVGAFGCNWAQLPRFLCYPEAATYMRLLLFTQVVLPSAAIAGLSANYIKAHLVMAAQVL